MKHFAWYAVYTVAKAGKAKPLICVVFGVCEGLDLCGF